MNNQIHSLFKKYIMKFFYKLLFVLMCTALHAQVGIGTPMPNVSAMLDVESTNKGLIIPRVTLTGATDASTITNGNVESLLVYNTATVSDIKPGYYYWSNAKWNKILIADDTVLGTVDNGLTTTNGNVRLGGELKIPTIITATSANTLAIKGLETGDINNDELVVMDKTTATLKKVEASALLQEKQKIVIANDGQTQFTPPLPIANPEKISVYRNGVKIDFTMIDTTTIKLETGVVCYQNDEIRIVQFN
jgi:hypothetical protein